MFAPDAMESGDTLAFGIDRDLAATHARDKAADLLANAKVKVLAVDKGVTTTIKG